MRWHRLVRLPHLPDPTPSCSCKDLREHHHHEQSADPPPPPDVEFLCCHAAHSYSLPARLNPKPIAWQRASFCHGRALSVPSPASHRNRCGGASRVCGWRGKEWKPSSGSYTLTTPGKPKGLGGAHSTTFGTVKASATTAERARLTKTLRFTAMSANPARAPLPTSTRHPKKLWSPRCMRSPSQESRPNECATSRQRSC